MLLAIEQGNTNTMFAIHDGQSWVAQWRSATESTRTADEYVVWLSQLLSMQGLGFRAIDAVIISSVVPQSIFNLRNLSRRYFNVEPLVIGENAKLGITVKDWRHKPDGKILVIPQSDDFMKSTLGRKGDWLRETVEKLNAWGYGPRIRVRPWQRDKTTAYVELHRDLDDAALVVTWSSASAITALYEGIPAISESGAAHALTGPLTQEQVAQPLMPGITERTRFLEILADVQFTLEEMRNGVAWRWLENN